MPSSGSGRLIKVHFVLAVALLLTTALARLPDRAAITVHAAPAAADRAGIDRSSSSAHLVPIAIDYPESGSIFPHEITPPTWIWRDSSGAITWRIEITFPDRAAPLHLAAPGEPPRIGPLDPRCISASNQVPSLSAGQAAAHTWTPPADLWNVIKRRALGRSATIVLTGLDPAGIALSLARSTIAISPDDVDGEIFYRDVPLMPAAGEKGIVQPLAPSQLYLINWRVRNIGQPESRLLMHDLHTCANCHSFSLDGKTMGMDVDGPGNDKGLYAIVPVRQHMSIRSQDTIAWNTDLRVGKSRVGFMSQVSPDGRYVLSTFAGPDQSIPSTYFVNNFKNYQFLQVFYPTRGILAWFDRTTGLRKPLPGADDPRYVQTDGVWSPDGKYVVFARAEARDPDPEGRPLPDHANDPNEVQIQYSLYRVPFNHGLGGVPIPIAGASANGMSNNFPKVSPDGRWIVFVKNRNGQLMRPDSQLWIVPFAGGVARRMNCNTALMNSWHSFSPNGRWLVFSSKSRSPYTQMFLTHIDANGNDSPPIYIENSTAANRAVNIPEFVRAPAGGIQSIDVPASDFYRLIDEANEIQAKGDIPTAIHRWRQALALDPADARANNGLGIALAVAGQSTEALDAFRAAVTAQPDFFEAWYNQALILTQQQRFSSATEAWRNVARLRPTFAKGQEQLGYVLYMQADFPSALAAFRAALAADPKQPVSLLLSAKVLATCPDPAVRNGAEAVRLAEQARDLAGTPDGVLYDTLAAAYAEAGRFDDAITAEQSAFAAGQPSPTAVARFRSHLISFQAHRPLRESPLPSGSRQ